MLKVMIFTLILDFKSVVLSIGHYIGNSYRFIVGHPIGSMIVTILVLGTTFGVVSRTRMYRRWRAKSQRLPMLADDYFCWQVLSTVSGRSFHNLAEHISYAFFARVVNREGRLVDCPLVLPEEERKFYHMVKIFAEEKTVNAQSPRFTEQFMEFLIANLGERPVRGWWIFKWKYSLTVEQILPYGWQKMTAFQLYKEGKIPQFVFDWYCREKHVGEWVEEADNGSTTNAVMLRVNFLRGDTLISGTQYFGTWRDLNELVKLAGDFADLCIHHAACGAKGTSKHDELGYKHQSVPESVASVQFEGMKVTSNLQVSPNLESAKESEEKTTNPLPAALPTMVTAGEMAGERYWFHLYEDRFTPDLTQQQAKVVYVELANSHYGVVKDDDAATINQKITPAVNCYSAFLKYMKSKRRAAGINLQPKKQEDGKFLGISWRWSGFLGRRRKLATQTE